MLRLLWVVSKWTALELGDSRIMYEINHTGEEYWFIKLKDNSFRRWKS